MVKVRKSLLLILFSMILFASAFIMFGCGDSVTTAQLFERLDNFVVKINADDGFLQYNRFKEFNKYNEEGTLEEIDSNYQTTIKIALDFVEEYYIKYGLINENYNYSVIVENLSQVEQSYDECLENYNNLLAVKDNSSQLIYNGFALHYQSACIDFINKVYDLAFSIKDSLISDLKLMDINFTKISVDEANTYLDFVRLDIANDCKKILINDCKGVKFEDNSIWTSCGTILNNIYAINDITLTYQKGEQFVFINSIITKLSKERANVNKALENFSIYNYVTSGQYGDLASYEAIVPDATRFYAQIEKYYVGVGEDQSYLNKLIEQLTSLYK